eukprot:3131798-Rhodomonas_salina.1
MSWPDAGYAAAARRNRPRTCHGVARRPPALSPPPPPRCNLSLRSRHAQIFKPSPFSTWANEAVRICLVRSEEDLRDASRHFQPLFTHQVLFSLLSAFSCSLLSSTSSHFPLSSLCDLPSLLSSSSLIFSSSPHPPASSHPSSALAPPSHLSAPHNLPHDTSYSTHNLSSGFRP